MRFPFSTFDFRLSTRASRGFTPTPTLSPFRFFKKVSVVVQGRGCGLSVAEHTSETKKLRQNWCRGFTLVELLISIAIFTILTGVVLARYRDFDTNAKFANASEDVVLALRQAQVYGVGVRGEAGSFTMPYGVYFTVATPRQIVLFADRNSDGRYTAADNPVIETTTWQSGISISALSCTGIACGGNELSVTFKRPSPNAIIADNLGPGYLNANITMTNGVKNATIMITKAGQISLQ